MTRFVLVLDIPGIKQFVFGTDTLAETRGASALLDWLNREITRKILEHRFENRAVVYAAGGAAQAVLQDVTESEAREVVQQLAHRHRQETGGEVHLAWGLAAWDASYKEAVHFAHTQMRVQRETDFGSQTIPLLPVFMECSSMSHLPAQWPPISWGGEHLLLSTAARRKRKESREAVRYGAWADWMKHLQDLGLSWPPQEEWTKLLRPEEAEDIGEASGRRRGYVGMVYCDGNAMGRLVQQLDSPETTTAFSDIVDGSICEACHEALDWVCASEIAQVRKAQEKGEKLPFLPADILLLGGDDLLVLLPADRALIFAERVADIFATRTREKIDKLPAGATRHFFMNSLQQKGMTISCGVALAPAKYPFYLLRELAEALLKNAKKKGSKDPTCQPYWAPAYIDFHLVAGSSSQDLGPIRMDDYYCSTDHKRTLRPYRLDQLGRLRDAVTRLHQAGLPRSKVQDFFDAALDRLPRRTERRAREVFGRCSRAERQALWLAVQDLAGSQSVSPDWFPWLPVPVKPNQKEKRQTPLADLMEAYDLFPEEMP